MLPVPNEAVRPEQFFAGANAHARDQDFTKTSFLKNHSSSTEDKPALQVTAF